MLPGKPIVARACAAIPETVGNAALLMPEAQGPALMGEALAEVAASHALRTEMVARGRERVAELSATPPETAMLDALLQVV